MSNQRSNRVGRAALAGAAAAVLLGACASPSRTPDPAGAAGSGAAGTTGGTAGTSGMAGTSGTSGTGGTGGTAGTGGTGNTPLEPRTTACPGAPGMVGAELAGGHCFKIDALPVTRGEFHRWAEAHKATSGPRGHLEKQNCDYGVAPWREASYAWWDPHPDGDPTASDLVAEICAFTWPPPPSEEQRPMSCVDWCQAAAYCSGQGKRLCGEGVVVDELDGRGYTEALVDPSRDEWYSACSAVGTRSLPYGNSYEQGRCDSPGIRPATCVGNPDCYSWWRPDAYPGCEGGFSGLRMMGPVYTEWTGVCDRPDADGVEDDPEHPRGMRCLVRGGCGRGWWQSIRSPEDNAYPEFERAPVSLFRCCSD